VKGKHCYRIGGTSFQGNNVLKNEEYGLFLNESSSDDQSINQIEDNIFDGNGAGIQLNGSHDNTIFHNEIVNNSIGTQISNSSGNLVYGNNFVDNIIHAESDQYNYWDNGYPKGGNYWSGNAGIDVRCGSGMRYSGNDNIGDSGYFVDDDNLDKYPLLSPFWEDCYQNNPDEYLVDLGSDIALQRGKTIVFDDVSILGGDDALTYTWSVNCTNRTEELVYDEELGYDFVQRGNYTVTLNISFSNGYWRSDTIIVRVLTDGSTSPIGSDLFAYYWMIILITTIGVLSGIIVYLRFKKR
jgi:parallel beta-helix repeat protein